MPAGRPLKFQSAEELQAKVDEYFTTKPQDEWTITGLANFLETSRETLMNYEEREEFFDTVKKAKGRIEEAYEIDLRKKGNTGTIFALKNFGWKDKQEVENTNLNADVTERLTEEQKSTLAQRFIRNSDGK